MPKSKLPLPRPPAAPSAVEQNRYIGPQTFAEITGQAETIERMRHLIGLHKRYGTVLGHILLVAPEGQGKRTIAHAVAREFGVNLQEAEASSLERAGDLAVLVSDLDKGDILLLKNVNRIRKISQELLLTAMRNYELNIVVGKGPVARTMKLAIKPFTCVGTITSETECPRELREAFDATIRLQPYRPEEILELTARALKREGVSVDATTTELIARLAIGNPKKAQSIIGRLAALGKKDFSPVESEEFLSAYGHIVGQTTRLGEFPDLMSLSGIQFERIITELLEKMGFRAEMTKATGDGGIDVEALLDKPIVGGRYLVQCKRFAPESLVGGPTVREFYGALTADRKAVKGILITTSGFTSQALDFAAGLPIELIDGKGLAELLSAYFPTD